MPVRFNITIQTDGPYWVTGAHEIQVSEIALGDEGVPDHLIHRGSLPLTPEGTALCRCGQSRNKPFCDGHHAKTGFDGTETASRQPYEEAAGVQTGPLAVLTDQEDLCAFARFCDGGGKIWRLIESPMPADVARANREAGLCPSGRLKVWDRHSRLQTSPEPQTSALQLLEDPAIDASAALAVSGSFTLQSANGETYPERQRMTLCRCGQSGNKPFCDGSHASTRWQDGL